MIIIDGKSVEGYSRTKLACDKEGGTWTDLTETQCADRPKCEWKRGYTFQFNQPILEKTLNVIPYDISRTTYRGGLVGCNISPHHYKPGSICLKGHTRMPFFGSVSEKMLRYQGELLSLGYICETPYEKCFPEITDSRSVANSKWTAQRH